MLPHQASASMVLCFVENGSNKRRYHRSSGTTQSLHQYSGSQNPKSTRGIPVPASQLKDHCYLVLDKYRSKAGLPRSRLYEGVQKCLDQLIERVEDKLMSLDPAGTY